MVICLEEIGMFVNNHSDTAVKMSFHKTTHFVPQNALFAVHSVHLNNAQGMQKSFSFEVPLSSHTSLFLNSR